MPQKNELKKLTWCYNKRGFIFDTIWSDGYIFKETVKNPIEIIENIKNGERVLFLMHPQYYGDKLRSDWETIPVSKEQWWKKLWNL